MVLGSGVLLAPNLFISWRSETKAHLIIIGTLGHTFVEEYCSENPSVSVLRLNRNSNIETAKTFLSAKNTYLIITTLLPWETAVSLEIMDLLVEQRIDFKFLGITPLFNNSAGLENIDRIKKTMNNEHVSFFDVNAFLRKLRETEPDVLAVDAFGLLEGRLRGELAAILY